MDRAASLSSGRRQSCRRHPNGQEGQLGQLPEKRQRQARDGPANPPRRGQPLGQQRGGRPPGHPRKRAESGRSRARQLGGIQRQNHHSNGGGQAFRGGAAAAHRARASSSPIWAAGLPGPRWKGKRKSSLLPRLPELTRMTLTGLEVSLMLLLSPAEPPRHRVEGERVEGPSP